MVFVISCLSRDNLCEFSGIEADNSVEVHKRTRLVAVTNSLDNRPQTRQLKEAGASTYSDDVIVNKSETQLQGTSACDQTIKFKPVNETSIGVNSQNDTKAQTNEQIIEGKETRDGSKATAMTKGMSYGSSS